MDITLEIRLDSLTQDDVHAVEEVLEDPRYTVTLQRWPRARALDPVTVFGLVGGAIGLMDALESLKERWITRRRSVKIQLRNEDGDEIDLTGSNRADLQSFLERSSSIELVPPPD